MRFMKNTIFKTGDYNFRKIYNECHLDLFKTLL